MENSRSYSNRKKNSFSGFTLIEVLLVIGIFSVVVFAGLPLIRGILFQNDLESTSLIVVSTLRQAENSSRNGLEDSVWGVRINYPQVILFKGGTYVGRDVNRDVIYTLNSNIVFSGLQEVTYSKMHGNPSTTGNITFTNLNNISTTININAKGRLSY